MKEIIFNAETGETTERAYTAAEIAEVKKANDEIQAKLAAIQQKNDEKLALLEKLGLTVNEAKLLLS